MPLWPLSIIVGSLSLVSGTSTSVSSSNERERTTPQILSDNPSNSRAEAEPFHPDYDGSVVDWDSFVFGVDGDEVPQDGKDADKATSEEVRKIIRSRPPKRKDIHRRSQTLVSLCWWTCVGV